MHKRLKLKNILTEDNSGGGAVHASGSDLASFLTAGGAIDWKNLIPDQAFGKYKSSKIGKTNVANNADGGLAHMLAMGVFSVEEVKDRLGQMGIRVSDLRDQDTIDFYKATKKFPLIFSLEEEIEGFFNGEKNKLEGVANVDERSNAKTFVMYFTYEGDGVTYKMIFDPKTLQKNVKGTDFDLPMLINNETYSVKFSKEETGENEEGEEGEETIPNPGENPDPPTPPSLKENRNEIFRQLLKVYGGFDGGEVFGDGFLSKDEAKEYAKLSKSGDKAKLKDFREKSSRNEYSNMITNLRKSFPNTFFGRLKKAFPEFNINFSKSVEESINSKFLVEEENPDKYKRWQIVFGDSIKNKTVDNLDQNIRGFMAAVKKWFKEPVKYKGKTQSYDIDFDGDKVNEYWNNFYGKSTKKESLKMSFVLDDLILEKKLKGKRKPPKGSMVGKGEGLDLSAGDSQSQERKIIINKIPTYEDLVGRFSGEGEIDPIFVGRIDITDDGGNSTWSLGNVESKLNQLLKNGVKIRPSKKDKNNWLVVYWSKPYDFGDSRGTEAMLISPKDGDVKSFLQKISSSGVVGAEVEVGKKVAGNEDITNPSKGKITLRPKI
jgi:hypothetical protein